MKRIYTFLILCGLVFNYATAQKIKLKKDRVIIDGNDVALYTSEDHNTEKFFYLNGEEAFTVNLEGITVSPTESHQWLKMTSAQGVTTEVPYEVLRVSFNSTKIIIDMLLKKYELFQPQGLNKENVTAFFAENRESLSNKYLKAGAAAAAEAEEREAVLGKYNPFVKNDGTIVFGGPQGTQIVGYIHFYKNSKNYEIKDLDGYRVAMTKTPRTIQTEVEVSTYTDEEFVYEKGSQTMVKPNFSRNFAQIMVDEVVSRGYTLGHQAKHQKEALHQEKVKVAKENSVNLYGVKGYVVDEDGKKYQGLVYAVFEPLDINPQDNQSPLKSLDNIDKFGKYVSVNYTNDRGKKRNKEFKAKNKVRFCIEQDDKTVCFEGLQTKGNALKKLTNATNFGFNNSYFYKEIYTNGKNKIYKKPGEQIYVIKIEKEEDGFMLDERSNTALSNALADYLEACSSLAKEVKSEAFDLNNLENLQQIIDEYAECE